MIRSMICLFLKKCFTLKTNHKMINKKIHMFFKMYTYKLIFAKLIGKKQIRQLVDEMQNYII